MADDLWQAIVNGLLLKVPFDNQNPAYLSVQNGTCQDLSPNNNTIIKAAYAATAGAVSSDLPAIYNSAYNSNNVSDYFLKNSASLALLSDTSTLAADGAIPAGAEGLASLGIAAAAWRQLASGGTVVPTTNASSALTQARANAVAVLGNLIYATAEILSSLDLICTKIDSYISNISSDKQTAATAVTAAQTTINDLQGEISQIASAVSDHCGSSVWANYTYVLSDGSPDMDRINSDVTSRADWLGFVWKHGWQPNSRCWFDGNTQNTTAANLRLPGEMIVYDQSLIATAQQDNTTTPVLNTHFDEITNLLSGYKANWGKAKGVLSGFLSYLLAFGGASAMDHACAQATTNDPAQSSVVSALIRAASIVQPAVAPSTTIATFFDAADRQLPDVPAIALDVFAAAAQAGWLTVSQEISSYNLAFRSH